MVFCGKKTETPASSQHQPADLQVRSLQGTLPAASDAMGNRHTLSLPCSSCEFVIFSLPSATGFGDGLIYTIR